MLYDRFEFQGNSEILNNSPFPKKLPKARFLGIEPLFGRLNKAESREVQDDKQLIGRNFYPRSAVSKESPLG